MLSGQSGGISKNDGIGVGKMKNNNDNAVAYDSRHDTFQHINNVEKKIRVVMVDLWERAQNHDQSKFESPEKEIFDKFVPLLEEVKFGTPEYSEITAQMKVATNNHNTVNRHHPEHFVDGIKGMNLIDLIEMLCDWKAAGERRSDGDILESIAFCQKRFGYSDELKEILENTANYLWIERKEEE